MTKTHQPLYLAPEAAATLQQLAAAVGSENQRGQASISALCEWLAEAATAAWPETVAALKIARACGAGEDWHELIEIVRPEYPAE